MQDMVDSAALADDPAALRARLASDGYLFFRGLLPTGPVGDAGNRVRTILKAGGWRDHAPTPSAEAPGRAALAEAAHGATLLAAMASRAFNRLPYLPPLRGLIRSLLGADAFSYPVKVLRAVHPEDKDHVPQGRHIHHDYGAASVDDMLTTWLPLMPIPRQTGGLAVLPGSNRGRPRLPRLLAADQRGWATTDYEIGDVLVFHCLTAHAALPNRSHTLRLSQDSRWQSADRPAPATMVYGPPRRGAAKRELYSRLLRSEPWWEPMPPMTAIVDEKQNENKRPDSRLFKVHPAWALYHRLSGPVH
jgi:Phytanoyl-CoA dioxygenase (PhyH)